MSPVPRRSNPSAEVDVGDTLETLISQFTDPFAFLRELVQNSLDANTTRVDIELEYDEPKGILTLHVIDTGEGMNREIIDTQLTRLFSSSKEGDLTKIGKFGIGFVSIFAIEPEYVAVDTGRDGEYWRVLFLPDR
ncbi:MAG TPA: ATP-binding protein, partial [Candidatus Nitrosotenuis sp.]|nr:ATP-binding protein [Candidatus Nitrosotenuis sp.]